MFKSDLKIVKRKKKLGVVDEIGFQIIPVEYDYVQTFNNELILARDYSVDGSNYKAGLFDKNGIILLPFEECDMLYVFDLKAPFGERKKFFVLRKIGDNVEFYSAICYEVDCCLQKEEFDNIRFMDNFVAVKSG